MDMTAIEMPLRVMPERGIPRRSVHSIQRARLLAATVAAVEELGYANTTVARVIEQAKVSRKTFYEVFANFDECFDAIVEEIYASASRSVIEAYNSQTTWIKGMRAAVSSLLRLISKEPALARIWFVEAAWGPASVGEQRAKACKALAEMIDGGRRAGGARTSPPALTAEATVGSMLQIVHARLLREEDESITALQGPFMYLIVLPYLGATSARAELNRKTPARPRRKAPPPPAELASLRKLNMRLTYRTVRALKAVGNAPGANSRTICEDCGITDQGQASKLLTRLERYGLIENLSPIQESGAPKEWHLKLLGVELLRVTDTDGLAQ